MTADTRENLRVFKVVSFESRRAKEMAELIRRYGGEPLVAPSMREIPLSENRAALEFLPEIEAGKFAMVIFMTGVGTRTLNQALLTRYSQERIVAALGKAQLVARGPKPVPEDLAPLRDAIQQILRGAVDVALFTNGAQVEHVFRVAAEEKADEKLRAACKGLAIGSVGPICTRVLQQYGLKPDIEPAHPKMGSLIAEVAASAPAILLAKRAAQS